MTVSTQETCSETGKKLPIILAVFTLLFLTFPSLAHATVGYNPPLPANTIFMDDFEGYSNSTLVGWGFFDNDAGCTRRVSTDRATSPIRSLELVSSTASGGKCDTHRLFGLLPGQSIVRMQLLFAYSNTTRLAGHQMTFSIETWDTLKKYECVVFWTPGNSGTTGLVTFPSDGGNTNVFANLMAYDDSRSVYAKEAWHYISVTCDLVNHKWIDVIVDDVDYTSQLVSTSMVSISDGEAGTGCTGGTGLCWGHMYRVEFANVNSGTPVQRYYKYVDNVLVTDATPAATTCGIQVTGGTGGQQSTTVRPGCISVVQSTMFIGIGSLLGIVLTGLFYRFGIRPYLRKYAKEES